MNKKSKIKRINRLISIIGLHLAFSVSLFSQFPENSHENILINQDDLKFYLEFLASDNLKGRATGSEGFDLAVNYADSLFGTFGLFKFYNKTSRIQCLDVFSESMHLVYL